MNHQLQLQKVAQADLSEIIKIEERLFSEPWEKKHFQLHLDYSVGYKLLLAKRIIGYLFGLIVDHIYHISNVGIDEKYQRKGYGFFLVKSVIGIMENQGITKFFLEVRESNNKALNLYKKLDFRIFDKKENYYANPQEDALILGRILEK